MQKRNWRWLVVGLVAGILGSAAQSTAKTVDTGVRLPGWIHLEGTVEGCSNHPGPYIRLGGELGLGGLGGQIVLRNNEKGTHETDPASASISVVLVPEDDKPIYVEKQPSLGGVGGNPHIWLVLYDEEGDALHKKPFYLGRCVQGLRELEPVDLAFALDAFATADIEGECSNSGGPEIKLEGDLVVSGLHAKVILTNNRKWTHKNDDIVAEAFVVISPDQQPLYFSKQPPMGGAGGNPIVLFGFTDDVFEEEYSSLYRLGRCVQLSQ